MSRGPIRHKEDLGALPKEDSFVFQDHLPGVVGGLVRYWKDPKSGHVLDKDSLEKELVSALNTILVFHSMELGGTR